MGRLLSHQNREPCPRHQGERRADSKRGKVCLLIEGLGPLLKSYVQLARQRAVGEILGHTSENDRDRRTVARPWWWSAPSPVGRSANCGTSLLFMSSLV